MAALIAAVASLVSVVGTAVISSRNTVKATTRTVEAGTATANATLAAACEDRLWEKRAAVYEETLSGLLHRQATRRHKLRGYRLDEESEQWLADFYNSYEAPGMFEMHGRLVAYASELMLHAYEASRRAHHEVRTRCQYRQVLAKQAKVAQETRRPGAAPDGYKLVEARKEIGTAVEEAEAADQAFIEVIREELRSRPKAIVVPASAQIPRHRRLWRRGP